MNRDRTRHEHASAVRVGRRARRIAVMGATLLAMVAAMIGSLPASAAVSITAFTIEGGPGAYVGGSLPQVYTPPEATFSTEDEYRSTTKNWIFLRIWGVSGTALGNWFYVNLVAPDGQDLAVGAYPNAVRAGSSGPGEPGLDIYGNGAGCNQVGGAFTIHELAFSGVTLTRLAASYELHCEGGPAPAIGEIRYESTLAFVGLRQLPNTGYNSIGFPNAFLGESSPSSSITLENVGNAPISVTDTGWSGEHPDDFALTSNTCTSSLDPGESCEYELTFTPTIAGYRQATFEYTTDTYGVAHGVRLVGTAVVPEKYLDVQPSSVDFGSVVQGQLAPASNLTLRNFGNHALTIDSVTIEGDAAFTIASQGCPIGLLASGDSCTVSVQFQPGDTAAHSAQLQIAGDQQGSPSVIPLSGQGILPASGVAWGTTRAAGPGYTWNSNPGMARTVQSGAQRLHVAYATDRIGSSWAKNTGPYMGIYYVRSSSGSTWTTAKRINPTNQHAARVASAAAGSRVYVTWVSQTRVTSFSATAPRVLYVRVNTNHGSSTAWGSTIRFTSTSGRVDYPSIAAYGNDVYLAYTDSVTGIVRVAVSHDRGVTWSKKTMGTTTASSSEGRAAYPSVAVSGSSVIASWRANSTGTMVARRSTDRGVTWSAVETLTTHGVGAVSAAARGSRVAVAWTTGAEIHVREAIAGTWGSDRLVGGIGPGSRFAYAPAVALQGNTRLAVAWTEQLEGDFGWARLNWTESPNDGALWYQTQVLASTSSSSHRSNDWPTVLWPSESTRQILYNGWTYGTNNYRLYFRSGAGAPVGPAIAAVEASGPAILAPQSRGVLPDRAAGESAEWRRGKGR